MKMFSGAHNARWTLSYHGAHDPVHMVTPSMTAEAGGRDTNYSRRNREMVALVSGTFVLRTRVASRQAKQRREQSDRDVRLGAGGWASECRRCGVYAEPVSVTVTMAS